MPNAVDGTVSVVVVHEVVLLSDAPDGPERIAQAHVVGLPVLVFVSVIGPVAVGLPEKVTAKLPLGVKLATTGVSCTVMVRCAVSVSVPFD